MIEKRENLIARQRPGEPLHIVLNEHLNSSAVDRTAALDRGMHTAANRHVSAEQMFSVEAAVLSGKISFVSPPVTISAVGWRSGKHFANLIA